MLNHTSLAKLHSALDSVLDVERLERAIEYVMRERPLTLDELCSRLDRPRRLLAEKLQSLIERGRILEHTQLDTKFYRWLV